VNKKINYWSPLSCLVEEQEEADDAEHYPTEHLFSILTEESKPKSKHKITEKWKQKMSNRSGILDTGCTSGARAEQDMDCFLDTGQPSTKEFILPNKTKIRANQKMLLKHNLCRTAGKMNIIPDPLLSVSQRWQTMDT